MSDQPTYCPLCGTKEPHECECKPAPKTERPKVKEGDRDHNVPGGKLTAAQAEMVNEWRAKRAPIEEVDLHQQHPSFDIKLDF